MIPTVLRHWGRLLNEPLRSPGTTRENMLSEPVWRPIPGLCRNLFRVNQMALPDAPGCTRVPVFTWD